MKDRSNKPWALLGLSPEERERRLNPPKPPVDEEGDEILPKPKPSEWGQRIADKGTAKEKVYVKDSDIQDLFTLLGDALEHDKIHPPGRRDNLQNYYDSFKAFATKTGFLTKKQYETLASMVDDLELGRPL